MEVLPIVDITEYLNGNVRQEDIDLVRKSFVETSCLILRDPRVTFEKAASFLDLMEDYYAQPTEVKMKDVHPEWSYQIGATPEMTERPRDNTEYIVTKLKDNLESQPTPTKGKDPKWRFFHPYGKTNPNTKFPSLNQPNVVPEAFADRWISMMDGWAECMITAVRSVSELLAMGLGLEKNAFTNKLEYGRHLLAPTGSDLNKYGELGTVLAGFHFDLNYITIHSASKYPGLFIWLRNGKKLQVKVPKGCLLLQAGKQLEWMTGGLIESGMHEVVVIQDTLDAMKRQQELGRPLWRVSSTLFSHIASDENIAPLKEEWKSEKYPDILCGDYVVSELKAINLGRQ
ncbi:hypothetical protein C9374_011011 [Naegleria lovaniensis]|uniref:Isopenicillin N synthase-like Fe(2+) 2OG dioxygenase domain-containing protein n=1 Tax=Naegleria lovaniensis TaxID=51637 RepID=A0AA88GGI4_NAELO|nr:uncharacterized protein C9374_011011 [Naegleria lovaniensis]KAG2374174.1 hypothetical protein C9374_011011 [Naegleria lovaniensis]